MHVASSLQDGVTPLMVASAIGNVECVKTLLEKGAQVNIQDKVCQCLYIYPCLKSSIERKGVVFKGDDLM